MFFTKIVQKLKKSVHTTGMMAVYKTRHSNNEILEQFFSIINMRNDCSALDLGSGPNPRNPFNAKSCYGVDIRGNDSGNVIYADLVNGILPFEDGSFQYVTAYDVLEHIPRVSIVDNKVRFPFILLMNEIFRVLSLGGLFFNIQPCYPAKEAFQDPTHINIMTEDTMQLYFCESAWARIYGYDGSFSLIEDGWLGPKYFSFLKKTHDTPIRNLEFIQK